MALDFNSLVPETSAEVLDTTVNPTVPWIQASKDEGVTKQVTVPAADAKTMVNLLTRGAETAELGLITRVKVGADKFVPNKKFWDTLDTAIKAYAEQNNGAELQATVIFTAKDRVLRPRTPQVNG